MRLRPFLLLTLLLFATLAGCQSADPATPVPATTAPEPTAEPTAEPAPDLSFTVTDALGREVRFEAPPSRIVLTGRALFMIADAAYIFPGATEKIIGMGNTGQGSVNFIADLDPVFADKVALDRDAGAEQIAALRPDLVLLKSFLADSVGAPIEALGIPVVYLDLETVAQYNRDLLVLGQIFGDEERAERIIAWYQAHVARISNAVEALPKPRVLLLSWRENDGAVSFNVPPDSWLQTEITRLAGGDPIWTEANSGTGWQQVSLEQIAAWDADQIYIISYNKPVDGVVAELKADPNWQALRATQAGTLYGFPGDYYSWDQPDVRWLPGLIWLAGRIHPEAFPDSDIVAEVQQFYETLYGVDAEFFNSTVVPRFSGDWR
jgi:iron complex transport system substrate-binding protein